MLEALIKARTIDTADEGVQFQDHMEVHHASTQAVLFSLLHWMSSLDSETAKASSGDAFELIIQTTLGPGLRVMILDDSCPAGSLPTNGVKVTYDSHYFTDASQLAAHFPFIKRALGNKNRKQLVEEHNLEGMIINILCSKTLVGMMVCCWLSMHPCMI